MSVSLILTCYNEREGVGSLLQDVLGQSALPEEMVILDAGSSDGTVEVLDQCVTAFAAKGVRLTILAEPGASIARGRNRAIEISGGDTIAVTDAGCRLERNWLERLTSPIVEGRADFVAGFYRPVARTRFQKVLAALTTGDAPAKGFLPSSRSVAFKKALWKDVGGYPEWLRWGEDTLFDRRCLGLGARYWVAADAVVHWEVRRTWRAAFKQFLRYAYGDGMAGRRTLSLLVGPLAYGVMIVLCSMGFPAVLLLIPLLGGAWVARRGNFAKADLGYAVALAAAIQLARTLGYVGGWIVRFAPKVN